MIKKAVVAAALLMAIAAPSFAATGNDLIADSNSEDNWDRGNSLGYMAGVSDSLVGIGVVCPGDNWTYGQAFDIVKNYIKANPETRNSHAAILITESLIVAWPCKKEEAPATKTTNKTSI